MEDFEKAQQELENCPNSVQEYVDYLERFCNSLLTQNKVLKDYIKEIKNGTGSNSIQRQ